MIEFLCVPSRNIFGHPEIEANKQNDQDVYKNEVIHHQSQT